MPEDKEYIVERGFAGDLGKIEDGNEAEFETPQPISLTEQAVTCEYEHGKVTCIGTNFTLTLDLPEKELMRMYRGKTGRAVLTVTPKETKNE